MVDRVCGTCRYARDDGGGNTVCTHDDGHHFGVVTTACKQPRRWWRERAEHIPIPVRATLVSPTVEPDHEGQMRLALPGEEGVTGVTDVTAQEAPVVEVQGVEGRQMRWEL